MSKDKIDQDELKDKVDSVDETNAEEHLKEEVEQTEGEKYAELNNKYVRLYSDFDNFRKRTIKEKADTIIHAGAEIITDILPVLDDFERAIANNENSEDIEVLKEGFKLIHHKLEHILKSKGLEAVDATGEVFDAELHEAITNIPAPTEDDKGKVIDCVEKGYKLRGKALRYPKVVVGQ